MEKSLHFEEDRHCNLQKQIYVIGQLIARRNKSSLSSAALLLRLVYEALHWFHRGSSKMRTVYDIICRVKLKNKE